MAHSPPPPSSLRRLICGGALVALAASLGPPATAAAAAAEWLRPVAGEATRSFEFGGDPFAAGQHRGVDLAAPPGAPVRSACDGVVTFAGPTPGHGRGVSVRCGGRRLTYLPLRAFAVRRGAAVERGDRLGWVGDGHRGALHVGVRVLSRRFGYVDPLPLFGDEAAAPPALPRVGPPSRRAPRLRLRPPPTAPRVGVPIARPAPVLAPWPVWLGLGLLLLGAAGGTTITVRRRQLKRGPVLAPARRAA